MAIVGNVLILVALQSDSHLFPTSRMLFRSLASTDLCVGLISQPCFGIFLFSVITNRMRICKITEGILHASSAVLCGISLSNLTAISVDRLLALQLGLRYRQVVTVPRVRGVIALSWLVYWLAILLERRYLLDYFASKHTLMYYSLNSLLHENRCHYASSSSSDLRTGTTE